MPNNFDMSSTGTNIEAVAFYDICDAQYAFKENFEILNSGRRSRTYAYYIDYGNVKGADEITFSVQGERAEKERFCLDYVTNDEDGIKDWTEDEIDECILGAYGERLTLVNMEDFSDTMLKDYKLELKLSKDVDYIDIHGYSQGDYARVYFCRKDLADVWGNEPKDEDLKETFNHLFWDQPIYARITINDKEYLYEGDRYKFERDEYLKQVSARSGVSIETLSAVLPDDPEYQ